MLTILTHEAHLLLKLGKWEPLLRTVQMKLNLREALGLSNCPAYDRDKQLLALVEKKIAD